MLSPSIKKSTTNGHSLWLVPSFKIIAVNVTDWPASEGISEDTEKSVMLNSGSNIGVGLAQQKLSMAEVSAPLPK
ncbi:hypothetical protein [Desulfosarcina ovata]|uniref:Uncharacterized protein n=1 Tax=Desulfosarcina ovata subsp. ovata TaxID=2752305 RepID=A0A5K8AGM2_9BACT|nr:hypothetical protein [Desulfosarcina ovata]BBO91771.1 hypothetical protein DSCOOX_49510 [Desulfosarcina ovata subsp. ovata]